jgi:hypothetical protein
MKNRHESFKKKERKLASKLRKPPTAIAHLAMV